MLHRAAWWRSKSRHHPAETHAEFAVACTPPPVKMAAAGSVVEADTTDMKEMLDNSVLVTEVFEAFCGLARQYPGVIVEFQEAFNERAGVPELRESKGQAGLTYTLADLLWGPIPEPYFEFTRYPVSNIGARIDAQFQGRFRAALNRLALEEPHVLRSIKKYQQETGRSFEEILRAAFLCYSKNKNVYPY